jgi:probable rRNA maturation factor
LRITIKNLQKKIPIYPTRIKKSILKALKGEGIKLGEITVSFVNDKLITKLNSKYLNSNSATDVLAFNLGSPNSKAKNIFADIIISAETARRNSKIYKTTPAYELNLYSIHGVLHILGYNDHTPKELKIMREKETYYANS